MPIPRLINQLWIGDPSKRPARLMQTWKDLNPSCEYLMWTEDNLSSIKFRNQNKIDDMAELNGKCDIMRYEILYQFGGLFLDADAECVNTLDDFFFDNVRFSCYENEQAGIDEETKIVLISSAHVGYEKKDPFLDLCIEELGKVDMVGKRGWQVTGNRFLGGMVVQHPEYPMKIYPSWYFIPKHGTGREYTGSDKIYAKHYWGSTFNLYGKI